MGSVWPTDLANMRMAVLSTSQVHGSDSFPICARISSVIRLSVVASAMQFLRFWCVRNIAELRGRVNAVVIPGWPAPSGSLAEHPRPFKSIADRFAERGSNPLTCPLPFCHDGNWSCWHQRTRCEQRFIARWEDAFLVAITSQ